MSEEVSSFLWGGNIWRAQPANRGDKGGFRIPHHTKKKNQYLTLLIGGGKKEVNPKKGRHLNFIIHILKKKEVTPKRDPLLKGILSQGEPDKKKSTPHSITRRKK